MLNGFTLLMRLPFLTLGRQRTCRPAPRRQARRGRRTGWSLQAERLRTGRAAKTRCSCSCRPARARHPLADGGPVAAPAPAVFPRREVDPGANGRGLRLRQRRSGAAAVVEVVGHASPAAHPHLAVQLVQALRLRQTLPVARAPMPGHQRAATFSSCPPTPCCNQPPAVYVSRVDSDRVGGRPVVAGPTFSSGEAFASQSRKSFAAE